MTDPLTPSSPATAMAPVPAGVARSRQLAVGSLLALIALSFAAAAAQYQWIENPIRHAKVAFTWPRVAMAAALPLLWASLVWRFNRRDTRHGHPLWFVLVSGQPVLDVVFWRCVFGTGTLLVIDGGLSA